MISSTTSIEIIHAGDGNDTVNGNSVANVIATRDGNDTMVLIGFGNLFDDRAINQPRADAQIGFGNNGVLLPGVTAASSTVADFQSGGGDLLFDSYNFN